MLGLRGRVIDQQQDKQGKPVVCVGLTLSLVVVDRKRLISGDYFFR